MIVLWLMFIAVGLMIYAGLLKLAARILRYSVTWKTSFLFAGIMLSAVIFHHVLLFSAPAAKRIGLGVVLLLGLLILGAWFFSGRGTYTVGPTEHRALAARSLPRMDGYLKIFRICNKEER